MIEITMPRLSDTMEEGAISVWRKQPGDPVAVGDILVEIETDKATMEYEAYEAGTLSKILVPEGDNVSIGTPIALLDDGTDAGAGSSAAPSGTPAAAPAGVPPEEPAAPVASDIEPAASGPRVVEPTTAAPAPAAAASAPPAAAASAPAPRSSAQFASPLVRKLAREHGLDLSGVTGTGPGGRIIRTDIEHLLEAPTPAEPAAQPAAAASASQGTSGSDARRASEAVAMSQTRRVIARRLSESSRTIPHFMVTAAADAEALMALRADLNEHLIAAGRPKVSVNDLVVRACALALRQHPLVNASYQEDASSTMLVHHRINIGVAVASENGLVVPVIDDADQKTVTQLAGEIKELVGLANAKKLTPAQMSGGTFSISNLGMYGVEQFTAIINPPEAAILAVGGTKREPVVVGDTIEPRYRMRYTLSSDHRIVDGALAAQFLQTLTGLIENPMTILA